MLDCNLQLLAAFSNTSRALSKIFRASKVAGASAIASKVPLRLLRTFPRVTNPTVQRGQGRRREPGSRIRMYTPKIKEGIVALDTTAWGRTRAHFFHRGGPSLGRSFPAKEAPLGAVSSKAGAAYFRVSGPNLGPTWCRFAADSGHSWGRSLVNLKKQL